MTGSALIPLSDQLEQARLTVADIAVRIATTTDPDDLKDLSDRIRVAREWARVQKIAAQMRTDLLWLEVMCLRRIHTLGAMEILGSHPRTAARFFGPLSEAECREVLAANEEATTAYSVYLHHHRDLDARAAEELGRGFAERAPYYPPASDDDRNIEARTAAYERRDIQGALAAALNHFAGLADGFTIAAFADDVIDSIGIDHWIEDDDAFRAGVREVCREAVRRAPTHRVILGGIRAPRFVTCFTTHEGGTFVRIPFENADLTQFQQMVDMRHEQLREDMAALDRLERVLKELQAVDDGSGLQLGQLADLIEPGTTET